MFATHRSHPQAAHRRLLPSALIAAGCFAALSPFAVAAKLAEDPCTSVPRSLVSKALGAPVVVAIPRTDGPSRSCGYRTSPDGPIAIVTAFRYPTSAAAAVDVRQMSVLEARQTLQPPVAERRYAGRAMSVGGKIYAEKGTALYVSERSATDLRSCRTGRRTGSREPSWPSSNPRTGFCRAYPNPNRARAQFIGSGAESLAASRRRMRMFSFV